MGLLADMDNEITVNFRTSVRARRMRITIRQDGSVIATRPSRASQSTLEAFVASKMDWIRKTVHNRAQMPRVVPVVRHTKKQYAEYRKQAKMLVTEKLEHFNQFYKFPYKKIFIKNQKTRWGSCSGHGNLNFNYKILFLPPNLQDYLVVHELCHVREMNHSQRFWELVARQIPDYKKCSRELRLG